MKNKIILSTYCTGFNFGTLLQCEAIISLLKQNAFEPIIVEKKQINKLINRFLFGLRHPVLFIKLYKESVINKNKYSNDQKEFFNRFINELNICYLSNKKAIQLSRSEDVICSICGSDQIWNGEAIWNNPFYFLRFSPFEKNIAYAPSIGRDKISKYNIKYFKKYIKNIKYLSVREFINVDELKTLSKNTVSYVCDPTLLISKNEWLNKSAFSIKGNYIVLYLLSCPRQEDIKKINDIILQYNLKVYVVGNSIKECNNIFSFKYSYISLNVNDFPSLIFNSKLVITDSYHGLIFSIIGKIKTIIIQRNYLSGKSQNGRILDILNLLNYKKNNSIITINPNEINYKQLDRHIASSRKYLDDSIKEIINANK